MLNVEMPPSILSKAFDLLYAFNGRERVMTLSELSKASGLPKSTVHRLLARLIDLGAIEPHGVGYKIGLEMFQLGSVTPASALRDMAVPYLATVHRWTGHTVLLGVLRSFDVVFSRKSPAEARTPTRSGWEVGFRPTAQPPARHCSRTSSSRISRFSCRTRCRL